MISFSEWFLEYISPKQEWLILGKGPSFSRYKDLDASVKRNFLSIGMNHVARETKLYITHIADLARVDEIPHLVDQTAYLLMPWHPHIEWSPTKLTLEEAVEENKILEEFERQNRLLWYNLSSWPEAHGESPTVEIKFFSAEAILQLLGECGVKIVRTLGIEGGSEYAEEFSDLTPPAMHLHGTYSHQIPVLKEISEKYGIDFSPIE